MDARADGGSSARHLRVVMVDVPAWTARPWRCRHRYGSNVGDILAWVAHSGVVQGVIIGATLAFLTAILVMNAVIRTITEGVNGWNSIRVCGLPGNGVHVRAACAKALPAVNVFEEAAYWTTASDGGGQKLHGAPATSCISMRGSCLRPGPSGPSRSPTPSATWCATRGAARALTIAPT